jgi:hypothetical protein
VVEPGHPRSATGQFPGVQTRTAGGVKDMLARYIAEQRQAGRAVIVCVEEPSLGMVEELIGERVVLGIPADMRGRRLTVSSMPG